MRDPAPPPGIVRFGDYEVDLSAGHLRKCGIKLRLPNQSFQILRVLLERVGEVVSRDELRHHLWPQGVFVDFDNSLNAAIARLRDALSDSAEHPRYIETLPRRGYRFLGHVSKATLQPQPSPTVPRSRLLVLPFANQSGDPAQDYLSDAVTEEIIRTLTGAAPERVAVLARTTAMHYKATAMNVVEIGRELALDYIVEGSTRRTDHVIVISARLIQASDSTHLWTKRYEGALVDLFNIETAAAQAIAEQLGISATRQRRKPTQDMEAYNLYLQGRHSYENGNPPQSFAKAREYFEQALGRDPEFALAYDSLAEIYWNLGFNGFMAPKEALSIGLVHVLRAIEIDNTIAETHAMLAQFRKQLDFNWSEVRREMDLALQLNPVSPIVRQRYALTGLMPHGRIEEAVHELEAALELDPLFTIGRFWLAIMLWLGRRYDNAMQQGRFLVKLDESHYLGHYIIGLCSREKGMMDEAVAAHRRSTELSGRNPIMRGMLGMSLAESGKEVEARAILDSFREQSRTSYVPPTSLAWIHLGLGEVDDFFQWMDRAIDVRDHMITPIKVYPFLDSIRRDPQYRALLRKINLEM